MRDIPGSVNTIRVRFPYTIRRDVRTIFVYEHVIWCVPKRLYCTAIDDVLTVEVQYLPGGAESADR